MIRHTILLFFLICFNQMFAFQDINAFVYHRFGDDRYPSTNIDLDKFEAHLKYLKDNDYEVLTISEAIKRIDKRKESSAKMAAITIDDGFNSFFENGLPLLEKYGFPATLYVNTETVGAGDYMDWNQLRDAQKRGIEIGNHSHSHAYFLNEPLATFKNDLETSHKLFQDSLGRIPDTYAYPYGEWNFEMADALEEAKYKCAVAQNSGVIGKLSNRFYLPRFPMSNTYAKIDKFIEKLTVRSMQNFEINVVKTGYMGSKTKPRLTMRFAPSSYEVRSVQGFIQGSGVRKTLEVIKDGVIKLTIWPETDLVRRRTLFTVTARNEEGLWHWFSYLYVIPEIAEN